METVHQGGILWKRRVASCSVPARRTHAKHRESTQRILAPATGYLRAPQQLLLTTPHC
jgi:hypothetical protein